MKINKGIIKNVNKKLLSGTLVFALSTIPLTGCSVSDYNNFEYSVDEQGEYQMSGTIDYELLKDYCFIVIENSIYATQEFYICDETEHYVRYSPSYRTYDDITTGQEVFSTFGEGARTIVFSNEVGEYLLAFNKLKANYTEEEVKELLEQMKESYLQLNNKELIKEK